MSFLFYIDNQLTDQPVNDTGLITSIKRDNQLSALLITQDVELVYNGNNAIETGQVSGYEYLKDLFESGICNQANIEIYDQVSATETYLTYKGVIKIPQISIQQQPALLTCKIQDNSYYAYINNNRDLKVNFNANVTKSRDAFNPCAWYSVDMFNSFGCLYGSIIGAYYKGFLVTDALEFIVKAISDNNLGFRSDYLSSLDRQLFIFKGQALLNPYTIYPSAPDPTVEISFSELFKELSKIYNLIFFIDTSDPQNPVLRVEDFEYSFNSDIIHQFDDILEIKTSIDAASLYSSVLVGSTEVVDGANIVYTWNAGTSYYGWKQEQFFPLGQCNIASELNLVNEFIIDNNAIQDILVLGGTNFIDNYFLVQCSNINSYTLTAEAHQFSYFGSADCFYNLGINNFFKMQRHSLLFETNFGNFLGIGSNGFRALIGDTPAQDIIYATIANPGPGVNPVPPGGVTLDPVNFVNETTNGGYDGGNNYNNTTYIYTAPVSGNYSFLCRILAEIAGMQGTATGFLDTWVLTVNIEVYDSGAVFLFAETRVHSLAGAAANGLQTLDTAMTAPLNATDIVYCSYRIQYFPNQSGNQQMPRYFATLNTSFFEANGTPDGGVSITSGNTDVRKYIYEFTYSIGAADFRTIKESIVGAIQFEKDGTTRLGWIQEMQHNDWTGSTTIKLITQDATT